MKSVNSAIWSHIRKATGNERVQNIVAVPFFGYKASELLHLQRGDILVVDASHTNLKRGLVFPDELLKMTHRGVEVYNAANLIQGYYLGDGLGFIGPSNVQKEERVFFNKIQNSAHSILVNDPQDLAELTQYILNLKKEYLSSKAIEALKNDFVWPTFHSKLSGEQIPIGFQDEILHHQWSSNDERLQQPDPRIEELKHYVFRYIGRGKEVRVFCPNLKWHLDVEDWVIINSGNILSPPGKILHVEEIPNKTGFKGNQIAFAVFPEDPGYLAKPISAFSFLKMSFNSEHFICGDAAQRLMKFWGISFD